MKKITLYIFLASIFFTIEGCNDEINKPLEPCSPALINDDVKLYVNQEGILIFTDTIPGLLLATPNYFIYSNNISYLPLVPCNLPKSDYEISIGDELDILFSGNVVMYPPTVDAFSIPIELTKFQRQNLRD